MWGRPLQRGRPCQRSGCTCSGIQERRSGAGLDVFMQSLGVGQHPRVRRHHRGSVHTVGGNERSPTEDAMRRGLGKPHLSLEGVGTCKGTFVLCLMIEDQLSGSRWCL